MKFAHEVRQQRTFPAQARREPRTLCRTRNLTELEHEACVARVDLAVRVILTQTDW